MLRNCNAFGVRVCSGRFLAASVYVHNYLAKCSRIIIAPIGATAVRLEMFCQRRRPVNVNYVVLTHSGECVRALHCLLVHFWYEPHSAV